MKKQILVIHGGDSYSTHAKYLRALKNEKIDFDKMRASGWKDNLQKSLGNKFEVFRPQMPNRENARYTEWKIWFEKILPLMDKDIVLVGHSLGGIFLAKYLSENKIKKNIRSVFLVAAPFVGRNNKYDLFDFKLKNNFKFPAALAEKTLLYHSEDDPVVPFADMESYKKLLPGAIGRVFKNRGHFSCRDFPEIVRDLKKSFWMTVCS